MKAWLAYLGLASVVIVSAVLTLIEIDKAYASADPRPMVVAKITGACVASEVMRAEGTRVYAPCIHSMAFVLVVQTGYATTFAPVLDENGKARRCQAERGGS